MAETSAWITPPRVEAFSASSCRLPKRKCPHPSQHSIRGMEVSAAKPADARTPTHDLTHAFQYSPRSRTICINGRTTRGGHFLFYLRILGKVLLQDPDALTDWRRKPSPRPFVPPDGCHPAKTPPAIFGCWGSEKSMTLRVCVIAAAGSPCSVLTSAAVPATATRPSEPPSGA